MKLPREIRISNRGFHKVWFVLLLTKSELKIGVSKSMAIKSNRYSCCNPLLLIADIKKHDASYFVKPPIINSVFRIKIRRISLSSSIILWKPLVINSVFWINLLACLESWFEKVKLILSREAPLNLLELFWLEIQNLLWPKSPRTFAIKL